MLLGKFNSLYDLQAAFPTEMSCLDHLMKAVHSSNQVCPYCTNNKLYIIETRKLFKCSKCKRQISPRVGTIFEDSHIPLQKWFVAMYLITSHKKGISSVQLSKDIDVTQKTAWFMIHRIREMVRVKTPHKLGTKKGNGRKKTQGPVMEVDETYVGGKSINKHKYKRLENTQGNSKKTKVPVLGMKDRNDVVRALTVPNTTRVTLRKELLENIAEGTHLMTDENSSYQRLQKHYTRTFTNHGKKQFVKGDTHTNSIENFWSLLKRGIVGIYHHVSPKHLDNYLHEFTFRFNTKSLNEEERFNLALQQSRGRLTYKELIKFDPVYHNYSGRGPEYPLELLRETEQRGKVKKVKLKNGNLRATKRKTFANLYPDPIVVEPVKKKRGRPKKIVDASIEVKVKPKAKTKVKTQTKVKTKAKAKSKVVPVKKAVKKKKK